jgi:hypothetical protein
VRIDNRLTAASYQETASLQIYRTSVRPAVTGGSELWTLTVGEERALAVFERKILREMYGPVKGSELWRIGRNYELEAIIKGGPPLWSSDQGFWLQIQRSRVRFPALPDFLSGSGSGTGCTQSREPREVN